MNSRRFPPVIVSVLLLLLLSDVPAPGRGDFDFATAVPAKKQAVDVVVRRNPFQVTSEPDRPLPVVRDRDDPATKLPGILTPRVRSVIRRPRPLVLLGDTVLQPGDEVRLAEGAVLPNHRVVLKSIEDDRLVFHLTSLDPQQPGQVDVSVHLGPGMRRGG